LSSRFALGFGVGGGCWFVFEDVGEAGGCQGAGFGVDDGSAGGVDALEGALGGLEGFGFEGGGELGEGDLVEVAEIQRRDRGVEEVFQECVGDGVD